MINAVPVSPAFGSDSGLGHGSLRAHRYPADLRRPAPSQAAHLAASAPQLLNPLLRDGRPPRYGSAIRRLPCLRSRPHGRAPLHPCPGGRALHCLRLCCCSGTGRRQPAKRAPRAPGCTAAFVPRAQAQEYPLPMEHRALCGEKRLSRSLSGSH